MTVPFRVGIAGLGTVGAGVVRALQDHAGLIAVRAGRPIKIVAVSGKNKKKKRAVKISSYEWVDDPVKLSLANVDAVIELIGGAEGAARKTVEAALKSKKDVVTANKALMAHHGTALAAMAEKNAVGLNYEAAVAGGVPVIKTFREGLAGNRIQSVSGILNGTCNYILTEMRVSGRDFKPVLKEAQEKGYAEADPSFDIDGVDTAHKLSLLSALAFGMPPDVGSLKVSGIRHITAQDISYAGELGYRIRLLGMARMMAKGKIAQSVEPCLVPANGSLGAVEGVFNAVHYVGDVCGPGMLEGLGAGAGPTASAVVADIIDLARGVSCPVFGVPVKHLKKAVYAKDEDIVVRFYVHLRVIDRPGVIAEVSAILKAHKISIESFIQRGRDPGQAVSVVMTTHDTKLSSIRAANKHMSALSCMAGKPTLIRIEDIL